MIFMLDVNTITEARYFPSKEEAQAALTSKAGETERCDTAPTNKKKGAEKNDGKILLRIISLHPQRYQAYRGRIALEYFNSAAEFYCMVVCPQ